MVIDTFISDMPGMIAGLRKSITEGDTEAIRMTAHRLKSGSANLGASRLAALFKSLETVGAKNTTEGADQLLAGIEEHFIEVRSALLELETGDSQL